MRGKFLIPIFLGVLLALITGKLFFNNYTDDAITVFSEGEVVFFLKSSKKLNNDNFINMDDGSYIGISMDKDVINNLKDSYKDLDLDISEKYINNYDFITVLKEYDKLCKLSSTKDLVSIQNIVLSNYKEIVLNES